MTDGGAGLAGSAAASTNAIPSAPKLPPYW